MQIRSLLCKQLVDNNGVRKQQMLPISYCRQWERPAPSRNCNLQPCPPPANWTVGEWSKARHFQFFFKSKFWRWTFRYGEKLFGVVPWATQLSAAIGSWLTFRVLNLRRRKSDCIFSLNYFLIHLIPLTYFNFVLQCSVTCEKGVKQRVVSCVDIKNTTVNERFCKHNPKPPTTESCFAGSCKTDWVVSHKWSQVSAQYTCPIAKQSIPWSLS